MWGMKSIVACTPIGMNANHWQEPDKGNFKTRLTVQCSFLAAKSHITCTISVQMPQMMARCSSADSKRSSSQHVLMRIDQHDRSCMDTAPQKDECPIRRCISHPKINAGQQYCFLITGAHNTIMERIHLKV